MPIEGGSEKLVLDFSLPRYSWTIAEKGIYFFNQRGLFGGEREIHFLSFDTNVIQPVYNIKSNGSDRLTISPDEKYLLYSQWDEVGSDIWMVENWR